MDQDDFQPASTLRLPTGVVQPFNLDFAPDDLHVMAFFTGHDEYEAVEAMVRHRGSEPPLVRTILTRHDQSQVDHLNDDRLRQARVEERERVFRDIECVVENEASFRRAIVRFRSFRGEAVELDVTSLGLPDKTRGGLTDPGGHSCGTSLPMMYRGASALAAPRSRVLIDGRSLSIPTKIAVGDRAVAMEGYFSEQHHMAAIRSGLQVLELLDRPDGFKVGERWVYRCDGELLTYRISRSSIAGEIEVTRSDSRVEVIRGTLVDGRIELAEVRARHPDHGQHFVALTFAGGAFAVAIDGSEELVGGTVQASAADDAEASIALVPHRPAWAAGRPVQTSITRSGANRISVRTTIK
jgi:hypothetical protein